MQKRWVESDRGKSYYWIERKPSAPVLVFLHGLASDHTLFDRQIDYFRHEYTVLAWDMPAHGCSRPYEDFTLLHCAVELKRILDAEQIPRCVLIGHAMGALIAQLFVAHWPERVRGFVGIAASPLEKKYYSPKQLRRLGRMGCRAALLPFRLLHLEIAIACGHSFYARANMRTALLYFQRRELIMLLRTAGSTCAKELTEQCEHSRPTMLLLGAKDHTRGLCALCTAWSEDANIPLYSVRSAGHNAGADNPASVNRRIHAFINSLPTEIRG